MWVFFPAFSVKITSFCRNFVFKYGPRLFDHLNSPYLFWWKFFLECEMKRELKNKKTSSHISDLWFLPKFYYFLGKKRFWQVSYFWNYGCYFLFQNFCDFYILWKMTSHWYVFYKKDQIVVLTVHYLKILVSSLTILFLWKSIKSWPTFSLFEDTSQPTDSKKIKLLF